MNVRQNSSSEIWTETARPRILLIVFVLLLWIIAVAARLVYLQTFQHDWLRDKALAQQQGVFKASPLRGLIVDRKGRELARSIETESFFFVPSEVEDIDATIKKLSTVIEIDKNKIAEQLKDGRERKSKFESIVRKVDRETAEKIRSLKLKGVHSYKEPKRFYPNNELAGDVLGFVNIDDVGISGLEFSQNERLQGEAVKVLIEKDASRNGYDSLSVSGRSGQTIVLTIDQMIQFYAQKAIAAAVQRTNSKSGTAIVLNVKTGEILAMANAPTFDPNNPREASPTGKDNDALQVYEPGSTFKIVAYSAAVEEGFAKAEQEVNCQNGEYLIPGKVVKDTHRYGVLTFTQALAKSSNIAAIKLGQRLGKEKFYGYIKKFGFGAKTGVELPYEDNGLLRPVSKWSKISMGSIPIGHEISVTPLQIASAFAVIANNGVRVSPYLIKEVKTADNAVVYEAKPNETGVVKNETAKTIQQMLMSVVSNGTGKKARLENYTVAGKTGTAQKINEKTKRYSQSKYVASFVGFAPANNPEVVIAVILDEPQGAHQGGEVAAPVFKEIAEKVLPELNIAPDIVGDRRISSVVDNAEEDFSEDTSGGDVSVEEQKSKENKNLARPSNLRKEKRKTKK
jgi:cell division protein FtsI (penicillin-binding protein 3)